MGINRINNNLGSPAIRNLNTIVSQQLARVTERLSSGLRLNRAGDDAASLTVAQRLQSQFRGLNQAIENAQNGLNLSNVADQSLESVSDRLGRIRELAVQAANTGVNDASARQALQAEVFQNIDEINRIAQTTQFGTSRLLNGDFSARAAISAGQENIGVSVNAGGTDTTLSTGTNFLQITRLRQGSAQVLANDGAGNPQVLNVGLTNATDIAVTVAQFIDSAGGGGAAGAATPLTNQTFNGATLQNNGTINFQGVLGDGQTQFSGTFQISAGTNLAGGGGANTSLADAIQQAIDQAEQAAGINTAGGTGAGETNVQFNAATGRLEFISAREEISQFAINFTVENAAGDVQSQTGITRQAQVNGQATGAQIGNNVNALTGSTFDTGQFAIRVTDVQAAQNRQVQSTAAFGAPGGGAATGTTSLIGATFGGATLAAGDTITLTGTNANGTTFQSQFTIVAADAGVGNAQAATLNDLIAEFNVRDNTLAAGGAGNQSGFTNATATLAGNGRIQVTDDLAATGSQTAFTITVNDNTPAGNNFGTLNDASQVVRAGNAERATVSIGGGPGQVVEAGQVVTLQGPDGGPFGETPQITLRIGSGLTAGQDLLATESAQFLGSLNGGAAVTFQNGDQNVTFTSGRSTGVAETLTLDFDAIVDVPQVGQTNARTVVISSVNRNANFQIGSFANQNVMLNFADVRATQLGLSSGRSIADIDITTVSGANEAIATIDAALDEINAGRSRIGSFQNRAQSTVSNLSVASENLISSFSRLQDADLARESTNLANARLLLNSNLAVLMQSNGLQNRLLSGLIG